MGRTTSTSKQLARILIVDDHPMIREALAGRIAKEPDMQVCGEAEDMTEALAKVKTTNPDLMIVDVSLKEGHGIDLIKRVLARNDKVQILVHSMYGEEIYAERSLRAGAMGYINKQTNPQIVMDAIRRVLEGKIYLSPKMTDRMAQLAILGRGPATGDPVERLSDRELEVFELIGRGLTAGAIANHIGVSIHTVDSHRENIKTKLSLKSAIELTREAMRRALENA